MSDTLQEMYLHAEAVRTACGRVLVGGLGLGYVATQIALKSRVREVTVVEIEPDVICLVQPSMPTNVTVVQADLHAFLRGLREWRWDFAFFDTWYDTSEDTWASQVVPLRRLIRRFFPLRLLCWGEDEMLTQVRRSVLGAARWVMEGNDPTKTWWLHQVFLHGTGWPTPDNNGSLEPLAELFVSGVGMPAWEARWGDAWDAAVLAEAKA